MKCAALFALGLALAACATNAPLGTEPDGLAMADGERQTISTQVPTDLMIFEIDDERFELDAGICDTFDDGTFRFSLAEGPVDSIGRATATIERFDTGTRHEVIIAFEGLRHDGSEVAWYARGNVAVHDMTVSLFGGTLEGTAVFDSVGGQDTPGTKAEGTFSIRCS